MGFSTKTSVVAFFLASSLAVFVPVILWHNQQGRYHGGKGNSLSAQISSVADLPSRKSSSTDVPIGGMMRNSQGINPTALESASNRWHNKHELVHVIYSRFMQNQPNLLHLGHARLELFETFCFPTIYQQTSTQFLWMIRADPDLHPTLKARLLGIVKNMTNVVVIGSNEARKGSVPGKNFRSPNVIDDVTADSIFHGSLELVQSYHAAAAANRTIIETNLDADDGLAKTYVETIQAETARIIQEQPSESPKSLWFNWCMGKHLEWQFYAPFDNQTKRGYLRFGSTQLCVTPGLSWVSQAEAKTSFIEGHHAIKRNTSPCSKSKTSGCWREIPSRSSVMAVRARSPTSTGMNAVVLPSDRGINLNSAKTEDESAWPMFVSSFGVTLDQVVHVRKALDDDLANLVEENLKGQCQKDHSCSEGINKRLKLAIPQNQSWSNKYNVVHIVRTRMDIDDKNETKAWNQVQLLRDFTAASLERQNTLEFFWVVEVACSNLRQQAKTRLLNLVDQTPVRMLLLKTDDASLTGSQAVSRELPSPESIGEKKLAGDIDLYQDYHRAATSTSSPVVETFLGPTDAIAKSYLEDQQKRASSQKHTAEVLLCPQDFMVWSYSTPVQGDQDVGFLQVAKLADSDKKCSVHWPGATRIRLEGTKSISENPQVQWKATKKNAGALIIECLRGEIERIPTNVDKEAEAQNRSLRIMLKLYFGLIRGDIRVAVSRLKQPI